MNIQSWFPLGIDWFDLLVVQGTLKSLLQYHNSKASILQSSAFFIVQLSHPYMTTGKTIALTRQILVGRGFPGGTRGKEPPANAGDIRDTNLIPGSGRSPGGGHGNPPQYSCLENPMDRGACWATVHRVTQSWTRLKHTHTHTHTHPFVSKVMSLLFNTLSRFVIAFLIEVLVSQCVQLFAAPWTVAHQAPLSMKFSRREYWSGLPFPSPGHHSDPGIEPGSPTLKADSYLSFSYWLYLNIPAKQNTTCTFFQSWSLTCASRFPVSLA